MTDTAVPETTTTEVEFAVPGMTCGSCAARVEKVLTQHCGLG